MPWVEYCPGLAFDGGNPRYREMRGESPWNSVSLLLFVTKGPNPMTMSQLQQTMATLRMSLAEMQNKEQQLDTLINQFRTQLQRLPRQVIYGRTPLDLSLSSMGEIEERLTDTEATRRRLLAIKKTAMEELAALESVKQVDEARSSLSNLKRQVRTGNDDAETLAEIRRLESFIAEHSKLAEQVITARYQERHGDRN